MSQLPRARYRTTNWPAYNASLKRRGSLSTRYDRKPANFLSGVLLTSIFIWLNVDSA